jgi:hypothetical protein
MTFIYHVSQGIPAGISAHSACYEFTPRLKRRIIPGIGLRANLKNDRIDSGLMQKVEQTAEILLHSTFTHSSILGLGNRMQPGSSELTLGRQVLCLSPAKKNLRLRQRSLRTLTTLRRGLL